MQKVVRAASDQERARYEFSSLQFEKVLKTDPNNAEALLGLGQDQIALGFPNKSELTLAQAEQNGSPETKALATQKIEALRVVEAQRVMLTQPNLTGLRNQLATAQASQQAANSEIAARRDQGKDQLKQISTRPRQSMPSRRRSRTSISSTVRRSKRSTRT